jgi:hypothetical protein
VIHNIFIAIISNSYESLKVKPIKRGDEEEDEDDDSMVAANPSAFVSNTPVRQGTVKYKSIG